MLRPAQRAALGARHLRGPHSYVFRRSANFEAGEHRTGHISAGPNEGIIFLNNLFPLGAQWLFRLPGVTTANTVPKLLGAGRTEDPSQMLKSALTSTSAEPGIEAVKVLEVLPRIKDGGAFLKFSHAPQTNPREIRNAVATYLREKHVRPWWAPFQGIRAGLVVGRPWLEDLYPLPTSTIRVEFMPTAPDAQAAEITQEQLYAFFRPYGKLKEIAGQPSDSKVLPKYAIVQFAKIRKSIMAKNCIHGYIVPEEQGGGKTGTILRLSYERKHKSGWILDWLTNHPRIVIPLLAALLAGITVTVFDPIRTLFIKAHVTRSLHVEDNKVYRWFKRQAESLVNAVRFKQSREQEAGMQAIWEDRKDNIRQIQTWLMETTDTFIVVQGPRGSGKKELVDQAIKERGHKLLIDCKPMQEARGDTSTIAAAAAEVGYRPVFSWMNSISGLIDLAAQGATGVKTGFSETLDTQLAKIWTNTATALKQLALEGRKKTDVDASLSNDEYLEAHPEFRPVVIIDNFLHKSQEGNVVYDKLAEWAASLTTSNIAHVVFLTHDVSFSKSLAKALPDRVFRQISLSDTSEAVAKRYVINHLDFDRPDSAPGEEKLTPSQQRKDLSQLDDVLPQLGGRLTDLEFLARRVKAGITPKKALKEIIDQASSEVLKMFVLSNDGRQWTTTQAWLLIKQLAEAESLRYNEVLLSDAYSTGGDQALAALEQSELITVQSQNGRPFAIKAGRPVFHSAFQKLSQDPVLRSKLDLALLGESIKIENKNVDKYEQELHLLGELPNRPPELAARVHWLLGKISASQVKIESYEADSARLKKVLTTEF